MGYDDRTKQIYSSNGGSPITSTKIVRTTPYSESIVASGQVGKYATERRFVAGHILRHDLTTGDYEVEIQAPKVHMTFTVPNGQADRIGDLRGELNKLWLPEAKPASAAYKIAQLAVSYGADITTERLCEMEAATVAEEIAG